MSSSQDTINGLVDHLLPRMNREFAESHPFMDKLMKSLQRTQTSGDSTRFNIEVAGPGTGKKIVRGDESYSYGQNQISQPGSVETTMGLYKYALWLTDLRRGSGPGAMQKIWQKYPASALDHMVLEWARQFHTGTTRIAGFEGFVTLNGTQNFTPISTSHSGVLQPVANETLLTNTVFGIPMRGAPVGGVEHWYHQVRRVASWAADGRNTSILVQNLGHTRKSKGARGPTMGFTDSTTFTNLWAGGQDQVRFATEQNGQPSKTMESGIVLGRSVIYNEPTLDEEASTTLAAYNGLIQYLDPTAWYMDFLAVDGSVRGVDKLPDYFFDFMPVGRIPGMLAYGHEFHWAFQLHCESLKRQGLVWNTNNP